MYKIREAAKLLNVETVEIHKKLISLKKELSAHVHKSNGITMIDEKGIDIISLSFAGVKSENLAVKNTESLNDNSLNTSVNNIDVEKLKSDELIAEEKTINMENDSEDIISQEDEILKIKSEINSKKNELNVLNQKIISELERTNYYTEELKEIQLKIKNLLV